VEGLRNIGMSQFYFVNHVIYNQQENSKNERKKNNVENTKMNKK
jgi:hypothetical protein